MRIAIIGSREGFTKEQVKKVIYNQINPEEDRVITGGARGVDTFAEEIIDEDDVFRYSPQIIRPINPANKMDYLFRNIEIITKSDKIIAFWDKKSRGSAFTIKYALERNKQVDVIGCNGVRINNEELRSLLLIMQKQEIRRLV